MVFAHYKISAMTPSREIGCVATTNAVLLAPQPRKMTNLLTPATQPFKKSPSFPHLALLAMNVRKSTEPLIYEQDAYDDDTPISPSSNDYHDSPISPLSDDQSLSYSNPTTPSDSPVILNPWLMDLNTEESRPPTPHSFKSLSPQTSPHSSATSSAPSYGEDPLLLTIKSAIPCILQAEYSKRPPHRGLPPLSPSLEYLEIVARTLTHTFLPRIQPNSSLPLTSIRVFIENKAPITISNEKFVDQSNLTLEVCADKTCKIE